MGLIDSSIRGIVGKAANFLMLDITIRRKSGVTYTPGTDPADTTTAYSVRGFVDRPTQRHISLGLAEVGDRLITLLQTQSPANMPFISPGDEVAVQGLTSVVRHVEQDPARATWMLFCTPGEPDGASLNVSV